jgi:predicted nucleic acid-binding protein
MMTAPGDRHLEVLESLLAPLSTAGNLTADANLAALAVEHGAAIVSCDADFERFSGVIRVNPLRA